MARHESSQRRLDARPEGMVSAAKMCAGLLLRFAIGIGVAAEFAPGSAFAGEFSVPFENAQNRLKAVHKAPESILSANALLASGVSGSARPAALSLRPITASSMPANTRVHGLLFSRDAAGTVFLKSCVLSKTSCAPLATRRQGNAFVFMLDDAQWRLDVLGDACAPARTFCEAFFPAWSMRQRRMQIDGATHAFAGGGVFVQVADGVFLLPLSGRAAPLGLQNALFERLGRLRRVFAAKDAVSGLVFEEGAAFVHFDKGLVEIVSRDGLGRMHGDFSEPSSFQAIEWLGEFPDRPLELTVHDASADVVIAGHGAVSLARGEDGRISAMRLHPFGRRVIQAQVYDATPGLAGAVLVSPSAAGLDVEALTVRGVKSIVRRLFQIPAAQLASRQVVVVKGSVYQPNVLGLGLLSTDGAFRTSLSGPQATVQGTADGYVLSQAAGSGACSASLYRVHDSVRRSFSPVPWSGPCGPVYWLSSDENGVMVSTARENQINVWTLREVEGD